LISRRVGHRWILAIGLALALAGALAGCDSGDPQQPVPDAALQPDAAPAADSAPAKPDATVVQDLSGLLQPILDKHKLPALAALVLRGETVVARGVVGVRKLGDTTKVTVTDKFHLGSCTKAMTATILALLVEDSAIKIGYKTDLPTACPKLAGTMHADYKSVTLDQVLAHRAGLTGNITSLPAIWNPLWSDTRPLTVQRHWFAEKILALAPEKKPGTAYLYSNAGYMVVGAALESAGDKAWEELMKERLFKPLKMSSCGFGPPAQPKTVDQPWGHLIYQGKLAPVDPGVLTADNPPALGPAGTVHCSLDDWGRFIALHLLGAQGKHPSAGSLLSTAAFTRLHTPWPGAGATYALGWGVGSAAWSGSYLSHRGSNGMWYASVLIAPKKNLALLIATNRGSQAASQAVGEATDKLASQFGK
jgi:CubicO group peptidase (beta-lactamase class C family)